MTTEHVHTIDLIDAPDLALDTSSGRVSWDERGNSIWEWQTAPGVYSRDISSQQLQALEARNLCLLDGSHAHTAEIAWSRNANGRLSARAVQANEVVMPMRGIRPNKSGSFDYFLRRLGLPA
ncbi:MAG: hypothetical protein AB7T07_00420 [Steroidobacteraceae bacterium]